jgi:hypothetical protein
MALRVIVRLGGRASGPAEVVGFVGLAVAGFSGEHRLVKRIRAFGWLTIRCELGFVAS